MGYISLIKAKHNFFKIYFLSSAIIEWSKTRVLETLRVFRYLKKKYLISYDLPPDCHNLKGIKLVTRLRLSLNHLREHKHKHKSVM